MVLVDQLDLMEDRIEDLPGIPIREIADNGFKWFLGQEYLVPEAIYVAPEEVDEFASVANLGYTTYIQAVKKIIEEAQWDLFDLPLSMRRLIIDSWEKNHMHLIGRFDIAGGLDDIPCKILEFNADTPTMLPETTFFQKFFREGYYQRNWTCFNRLYPDLVKGFKQLLKETPEKDPTIVITSLGYEEDVLNAEIIRKAAEEAGFEAEYADLELVIFDDDGVYLEFDNDTEIRFDFMFKLVPWEFIIFEEPELLDRLLDLQLNDLIYILNPAYSILMQNKAILPFIYKHFKSEFILPSTFDKEDFKHVPFVEKVTFGRLGENIKVYDGSHQVVAKNDGDWGKFRKIYQAFAKLYQDEDGDYYQPGIYIVDGQACALSFRRCEHLIVNDDSEYIPHFIE